VAISPGVVLDGCGVVLESCPDDQALLNKFAVNLEKCYKKYCVDMDATIEWLTAKVKAQAAGM
jgi:hypothetical protein